MTWVTPSSLPMASAVRWLSPVSMTTSRPSFRKAATAPALVGLGVSATAMRPSTWCSSAKYRAVLPWAASSSAFAGKLPRSTPASSIMARLPPIQVRFPRVARTPRPWRAVKFPTVVTGRFRFLLSSTMAVARGCSEGPSRQAARMSSPSSSISSAGRMSVTTGLPWVRVPVLSSTTVLTVCRVSRASADLMRMPFSAPLPVPTMMATGVARPRAQGQEMTSTATPVVRAFVMS